MTLNTLFTALECCERDATTMPLTEADWAEQSERVEQLYQLLAASAELLRSEEPSRVKDVGRRVHGLRERWYLLMTVQQRRCEDSGAICAGYGHPAQVSLPASSTRHTMA